MTKAPTNDPLAATLARKADGYRFEAYYGAEA